MSYTISSYRTISEKPGVYIFRDKNKDVLYVGKAKNLKKRVGSYFVNRGDLMEKTRLMVSQIKTIETTIVESELESLLLEAAYIKKLLPKYNVRLIDGKAYPLIRITAGNEYPAVVTARKMDDPESLYFGPYPNATAMHTVLKTLRRIFPFQATLRHAKRLCLYNHLGLCPCPPMLSTPEEKRTYRRDIKHIIQILEGGKDTVLKELAKERDTASREQQYEDASSLQKQIDSLLYVTTSVHKPFEYEINPNLRSDIREEELKNLQQELSNVGMKTNHLSRIECYDISNFQGSNATASMVVFIDGEKDTSLYRKFKIQRPATPDDFASMQEVLDRRFNHPEWNYPDLIVVDGGKGQISSAREVLDAKGIKIPLVGLAKREETIITTDFKEIKLPKNSGALLLMQRIRDEAHRFAITYHRKLRTKTFLT